MIQGEIRFFVWWFLLIKPRTNSYQVNLGSKHATFMCCFQWMILSENPTGPFFLTCFSGNLELLLMIVQ